MKTYSIYIVLTRANTMISRLIRLVKKDEYTHAAISLDKELKHMYSFGRKYPRNPFIGVFKRERINKGFYKILKSISCVAIELKVTKEQYQKVRLLLYHFIYYRHRYKYNYRGLYHSLFNISASYEYRFLCSEFVYHVLKESDILDLNIPRNLVRPQDFLKINGNLIYSGDLKEFKPYNEELNQLGVYKIANVYSKSM